MNELKMLLEFAVETCLLAGKVALQYFQTDLRVETKSDQSPVTIADRSVEQKIRERISKHYSHHGVTGEEFEATGRESEYMWYVDPIDGTRSFIQGVPIWGVMLGLQIKNQFSLGVVHMPALQEIIYAASGEGCFWNHRRAHVAATSNLSDALFVHSGREYFRMYSRDKAFEQLSEATAMERSWGDCYGHILVATGRADLCVDPVLNAYDAAPLIPILQEAGGIFSDWTGEVTPFHREGISTTIVLQKQILSITAAYKQKLPP